MLTARVLLVAASTLAAAAMTARGADLVSGNASLNILEGFQLGQFYPFNAPLGDGALRLDGASSPDVLYKNCWYYRTPIGADPLLFSELKAPTRTIAGDTATFTWLDNGNGPSGGGGRFDATMTIRLIDGDQAGQGKVTTQLRIRNINPSATTIKIYHLLDLDLPGGVPNPGPDDTLALVADAPLKARYTEASAPNYGEIDAPAATLHRIDSGFNLRSQLNGTVNDLVPETGPYTGDGAIAVQWTLNLAAGEERVIDTAFAINMPVNPPTCRADYNTDGGVTVQDIFDFLVAYFAGQPAADINGDGSVAVGDIFAYLVLYFEGCP